MSTRTAGFTLIEVMVALVVGFLALSAAATLFTTLGDQADRIRRSGDTVDRASNRARTLADLFANLDLTASGVPPLQGAPHEVALRTWCLDPIATLARCEVALRRRAFGAGFVLVLVQSQADSTPLELARGTGIELHYLAAVPDSAAWRDQWTSLTPPRAVALIVDRDTLLFRVGSGG